MSWKGSYLQGGADRTGDPILTNEVFHAMHIILSLKLGDHEGLALFVHGCLLKRTLLIVLPVILIQIPIHASLSPVWDYLVLPSSSWRDASTQHPTPRNSVPVLYIFFNFSYY